MTAPDRIPCDVPGCRRTAAKSKYPPGTRIMCGKHWRGISQDERRAFRKWQVEADAFEARVDAGETLTEAEAGRFLLCCEMVDGIWKAAIERACGI